MSSHEREEELRKRLRLIHLLHQTIDSYPTGPGTANQRRQWQQLLALADRIYSFPDPPTDTPLDLAIQQLQNLAIESIPDPPTNTPEALCDPTKGSRSPQDHRILDIYLEKEEGIIPDWQDYTSGPGIRYPKTFGWLWKLVPVNVSDEAQEDEEHYLMHPAQTSQWDDPWGEVLAWKFDPTLAYTYEAYVRYPEEFGSKSGLSERRTPKKAKANTSSASNNRLIPNRTRHCQPEKAKKETVEKAVATAPGLGRTSGGVNAISMRRSRPSGDLRQRLLRARGETYGRLLGEVEDGYSQSPGGLDKGLSSLSCEGQKYNQGQYMDTPWRNPAEEREKLAYRKQNMDDIDEEDDDLVGVSVRPKVPLRTMSYKLAIDMSHFIKEKGGLEGIYYSARRHRILDIYLETPLREQENSLESSNERSSCILEADATTPESANLGEEILSQLYRPLEACYNTCYCKKCCYHCQFCFLKKGLGICYEQSRKRGKPIPNPLLGLDST
nr:SIVRTN [synthetic construct]